MSADPQTDDGSASSPAVGGLCCALCGGPLRQHLSEGDAGGLHAHVWCEDCGAGGCLSTNMPGRRAVVRRGRALTGGDRRA